MAVAEACSSSAAAAPSQMCQSPPIVNPQTVHAALPALVPRRALSISAITAHGNLGAVLKSEGIDDHLRFDMDRTRYCLLSEPYQIDLKVECRQQQQGTETERAGHATQAQIQSAFKCRYNNLSPEHCVQVAPVPMQ